MPLQVLRHVQRRAQVFHARHHVVHIDVVGVHVHVREPLGHQNLQGGVVVHLALKHGLVADGDAAFAQLVRGRFGERGDLDRVIKCVRLGVFVNASPEYVDHPQVANGASDLIAAVFGEAGKHARAAVGVGSLPRGVAVEVDAIFEIK